MYDEIAKEENPVQRKTEGTTRNWRGRHRRGRPMNEKKAVKVSYVKTKQSAACYNNVIPARAAYRQFHEDRLNQLFQSQEQTSKEVVQSAPP